MTQWGFCRKANGQGRSEQKGKWLRGVSKVMDPHLYQLYNPCTWYSARLIENAHKILWKERWREGGKKEGL